MGEMGEAVVVLSAAGQVLYASPPSRRLFGRIAVGAAFSDIAAAVHVEDAGIVEEMRQQLLTHPSRPYRGHLRLANADGSWRHLGLTAVNRLQNQRVGGLVAVWRDITEYKRMEAAARLAHKGWQHLAADPIVILDVRGRVLGWNEGSERLLGWTEREVLGKVLPWIRPEERADALDRVQLVVRDQVDVTSEVERVSKRGERVSMLVTLSPAIDEDGVAGVIAIAKDLTAYHQLEESSRELALLQERERIAMDLHDGIIQSLYALGMSMGAVRIENERAHRPLPRGLQDTAGRVNEMIDELRAYISRLQRGAEQRSDLSFDLRSLAEDARTVSSANVEAKIEEGLGEGIAGELAANLVAIVHEALSNALRHAGAMHIWLEAGRGRNGIDLLVADDGRGFRPSGNGRRTSDGLWNMRRRADAIGAYLTIRSVPGRGARVWIRLGTPPAG
ncbi:MAG TPA: PAS domain S-box protein [Chloroflexota bacterium]|nr:PAS domain S-box protein [Chloroflexota bacterium]